MTKVSFEVPDDWWGLGVERVKRLIRIYGRDAKADNLILEWFGPRKYKIVGIGRHRISANSRKTLNRVRDAIQRACLDAKLSPEEQDRLALESIKLWRAERMAQTLEVEFRRKVRGHQLKAQQLICRMSSKT